MEELAAGKFHFNPSPSGLSIRSPRRHERAASATFRPAVFDSHVPALDIAGFAQALTERAQTTREHVRRFTVEVSNHRHRRLLRPRRERPGSRAAEKRDEFTPYHCLTPPVLPTERIAHLDTAEIAVARYFSR